MTKTSASKTQLNQEAFVDHLTRFQDGNRTFSLLFTRWMDTNGWSHPTMVALAKGCLEGRSWLHSSQISGLRHCTLHSPGPRTFVAIERLNFFLHRYATEKLLLPGSSSSNLYTQPFPITENGQPPELGWWVEVFCGLRIPKDIDLYKVSFSDDQAIRISENWGYLIRRLIAQSGIDLITELEKVVRNHYPTKDTKRVGKLVSVIHNQDAWNAEELLNEMPALSQLTAAMGGPSTEDELVQELRR